MAMVLDMFWDKNKEGEKLKMNGFKELDEKQLMDIDGGIVGVDDAIFWGLVAAGFTAGVAVGISRKNR